jgi:hypothetical protein
VIDDHRTNSQGVRDDGYIARPDPIGADVGPLPPIDAGSGDPADKDGAIDGLPGRYERQAEEDDEVGLDLTHAPLGATNG